MPKLALLTMEEQMRLAAILDVAKMARKHGVDFKANWYTQKEFLPRGTSLSADTIIWLCKKIQGK